MRSVSFVNALNFLLLLGSLTRPLLAVIVKSSDGIRIYADAKGNPANPHVVWIHGFLLGSIVFDQLFEDEAYLNRLYMVCTRLLPLLEFF